jgi:EAL domain-containing protein (putative c-di-GMP-specific phosphodiesterase class I)
VGFGPPDAPLKPDVLLDHAAREGRLLALDRAWRRAAIDRIAEHSFVADDWFFLNIDSRVLDAADFAPGFTFGHLARRGIPPERIVLELGERGSSLDSDRVVALARHYQRQGFRVAVDDVGRGNATLGAVLRIRPQLIKIDGEIVRSLATGESFPIVDALCEATRSTGDEVVAEGIETVDQLRVVKRAGIRYAQGYLLGRPSPELQPIATAALHALSTIQPERALGRTTHAALVTPTPAR